MTDLVLLGDFNAVVEGRGCSITGHFDLDKSNENEDMLEFCKHRLLMMANTYLKHNLKEVHVEGTRGHQAPTDCCVFWLKLIRT